MNRLLATIIAAIVALSTLPSSSALIFSPLLLKANPWGVATRQYSNSKTTIKMPTTQIISQANSPPVADFSQDEDLMRCKHVVLSDIYEKSLNRGFE